MNKCIISSLISIALLSASASALAEKGGNNKGHGVGGISEEHMSEIGAEHNKSHAFEKDQRNSDDIKKDKKDNDKYEEDMSHEKKERQKSHDAKHDRDETERETNSGEKKKWWQIFGDEESGVK